MYRVRRISLTALAALMIAAVPGLAAEGQPMPMHHMDTESLRVLRERVTSYATMTDDQINSNMGRMPGDYAWVPGDTMIRGDVGVLVLVHGAGPTGDEIVKQGVAPLAAKYPTAVGFGMAMMGSGHIQKSFNELTAAGAKTIVVVPMVVTEYASLYRQWDYILGRRANGAYLDVPKVKTTAKVVIAPAMSDHPLMTALLLDHAKELSTTPSKEVVILVGHGPTRADDNAKDTAIMDVHAQRLKTQGGFAAAHAINLQDDAPAPVRAANVAKLRGLVEAADKDGKLPIVVCFLMLTRGIQDKVAADLKGLDYKFQSKGITNHPNFTAWVRAVVAEKAGG